MNKIGIMGLEVLNTTSVEFLQHIDQLLKTPFEKTHSLCFVNAHTINLVCEQPQAKDAISDCEFILNDGIGVDIAAAVRGQKFAENMNGTDFSPKLLALCAEKGYKVYFLGTRQEILEKTVNNLKSQYPSIDIVGYHNGFFNEAQEKMIIEEINQAGTDVLFVAMGNPKQEVWLQKNKHFLKVKLGLGVGAFFDFTAGAVKRAPMWMQKAKIEWVFRLFQEPERLWRRYLIGNFKFIFRVLAYRLSSN